MKQRKRKVNDGMLGLINRCGPNQLNKALAPNSLNQGTQYYGEAARGAYLAYSTDGLIRNIVDLPVRRALAKWIECEDDLANELKRLHCRNIVYQAATFARLFGGSLVVAYCDDGVDKLENPLGGNLKKVYQFKVYDRFEVNIEVGAWDTDPFSPNYGNPAYYTVTPNEPYISRLIAQKVHHSRCFQLNGLIASNQEKANLNGWGLSALSPVLYAVHNYSYSMSAFPSIIKDFIQTIIKLNDLSSTVSTGAEGEQMVKARLDLINYGRSVLNSIMIDGMDDYAKHASSVAGLGDMVDRLMMQISAVTNIPVSLLFGRAPQGMNATGEGDENIFNEWVAAYQETDLGPLLDWIVGLIGKQTEKRLPENMLHWAWPDLSPIDEKDRADIKLKNAQADRVYIDTGAVDARWLYQQRHQEQYNFDVNADPEEYEAWLAENVPPMPLESAEDEPETII